MMSTACRLHGDSKAVLCAGAQADLADDMCASMMQDALARLQRSREWCNLKDLSQVQIVPLRQLQAAKKGLQSIVEGEAARS